MSTQRNPWTTYLVADQSEAGDRSVLDIVRAAIQGGVTAVQLRAKHATTREMVELGQAMHELTQAANIPLIINDRVDVALAVAAEGVHLGPTDLPVNLARQIIGPNRLLGVSVMTVAQAQAASVEGADYLGAGSVFDTPSKTDAGPAIGLDGLTAIVRASPLPVVAIGGITPDNVAAVLATGVAGVAVISAIVGMPDPAAAAEQLRRAVATAQPSRAVELGRKEE